MLATGIVVWSWFGRVGRLEIVPAWKISESRNQVYPCPALSGGLRIGKGFAGYGYVVVWIGYVNQLQLSRRNQRVDRKRLIEPLVERTDGPGEKSTIG